MRTLGLVVAATGANSSGFAFAALYYGHVSHTAALIVWLLGGIVFGVGTGIIESAARK